MRERESQKGPFVHEKQTQSTTIRIARVEQVINEPSPRQNRRPLLLSSLPRGPLQGGRIPRAAPKGKGVRAARAQRAPIVRYTSAVEQKTNGCILIFFGNRSSNGASVGSAHKGVAAPPSGRVETQARQSLTAGRSNRVKLPRQGACPP